MFCSSDVSIVELKQKVNGIDDKVENAREFGIVANISVMFGKNRY